MKLKVIRYKNYGCTMTGPADNESDWLGTGTIPTQKREYLSFKEAKVILSKENMRTANDWKEFCKNKKRPINIPYDVHKKYKDEWKGWADFLGKED